VIEGNHITMTSTDQPNKAPSRKLRAILAGGLVLGVGAAITLAAWNDSEFATGTFTAGQFNLEGSTTSGASGFADHDTAGTAAVVFDVADHGNVSPGDVLYEPFWVRLAANTTSAATLNLAGISPGAGGNEANLSYQIYRLAAIGSTCDVDGVAGGTLVGSGADLTSFTASAPTLLATGSPTTDPGAAQQLCFVVTAAAALAQGDGATTTWQFEAVSN
jgi:predicted ribosomally synthesized peptide with SipW-like signal peptide